MKIAVLLSGEYRSFEKCRPTMTFLNDLNTDVYVSTWDTTHHSMPIVNLYHDEIVTEEQIRKVLQRPATIQVELDNNPNGQAPPTMNAHMVHRWKQGIQMIQDSGIKYDQVIITRFDLFFNPESPVVITDVGDSLGSAWSASVPDKKLNDVFLISSYAKMVEFIKSLTTCDYRVDWHTWFYHCASECFNDIFDYHVNIVICRYFYKPDDTFYQIWEKHYDWDDLKIIQLLENYPDYNIEFWPKERVQYAKDKWNSGGFDQYKITPIIIKELTGFSGSVVHLMKCPPDGKPFVQKKYNIKRNYEKLKLLSDNNFLVPKIYKKSDDILEMEYIAGIDMKTFLLRYGSSNLEKFILNTIDRFASNGACKDYSEIYKKQLSNVDYTYLPFNINEIYNKLPKVLPSSLCHGDFTLENLIYSKDNQFYMIDAVTVPYDSWIFDISKLRQDLDGHWFIRNVDIDLSVQLKILRDCLCLKFPIAFDDSLYILMLLRVYQHCESNSNEHELIIKEIHRIWK